MESKKKLSRLTIVGLTVTALWVTALALIAYANSDLMAKMEPNAWGDFLAGSFSPLAFFWFVLGHFQQREELQQNTRALNLQAGELKNSVEQQQLLVEATRDQVKAEREALQEERERHKESGKPKLIPLSAMYSPITTGGDRVTVKLQNDGGGALMNIGWRFQDQSIAIAGNGPHTILSKGLHSFAFDIDSTEKNHVHEICAIYNDAMNNRYEAKFLLTVSYNLKDHSRTSACMPIIDSNQRVAWHNASATCE